MKFNLILICVLYMVINNANFIQCKYFKKDTSGCVFPFTFKGQTYNECIKGQEPYPWCSYHKEYQGVWKYCYDMKKSDLKCRDGSPCASFMGDPYPSCRTTNYRRMYCTDKIKYLVDSDSNPLARECPKKYKDLSPMHTRCLERSKYVTKEGISSADKKEIVQVHNEWRSKVKKPASGMMKLYWDDELAEVAQHHASRCSFAHDKTHNRNIPGTGRKAGQNIVKIAGVKARNISVAFNAMFQAEIKRWKYGLGVSMEYKIYGQDAGHLTEIYLDYLKKVGCGSAVCVMGERKQQFFVCNYDNLQHVFETKIPYKIGDSCSQCPNHCTKNGKLCDCKGRECFNGGILNLKTCKCECKGLYNGESCTKKIESVKQKNGCTFPFKWKDQLYYKCIKDPTDYFDTPICSSEPVMTIENMVEC